MKPTERLQRAAALYRLSKSIAPKRMLDALTELLRAAEAYAETLEGPELWMAALRDVPIERIRLQLNRCTKIALKNQRLGNSVQRSGR